MDRLQLQARLEELTDHVYFQPPAKTQMVFPCIVYSRDGGNTKFADNGPYSHRERYQVTVIDRNPDSDIPGKVAQLPMCTRLSFFAEDGLNHDVFQLYS